MRVAQALGTIPLLLAGCHRWAARSGGRLDLNQSRTPPATPAPAMPAPAPATAALVSPPTGGGAANGDNEGENEGDVAQPTAAAAGHGNDPAAAMLGTARQIPWVAGLGARPAKSCATDPTVGHSVAMELIRLRVRQLILVLVNLFCLRSAFAFA